MNRPLKVIISLTLAFFALLCGCRHKAEQMPVPSLPVAPVRVADVPRIKTFVGQSYGDADIVIQPRVSGYLRGIYFNEGSSVRQGQLLYVIDPAPFQAQLLQVEASLANAQSAYINAQSNYERMVPLAQMNAVSKSDLDNATASLKETNAQVKAAEANVSYARIQLDYTRLSSPIDGIIGRTNAKEGDYVGLDSRIPVLNTVSKIDTIQVLFYVPYKSYMELKGADSILHFTDIRMLLSDGSLYNEPGEFDFLGRAVDPSTGTIDVQVSFPNPERMLRPGQFAQISAQVGTERNVMLVPQKAISQRQGIHTVYVLGTGHRVAVKNIITGDTYGTDWIVSEGLEPTDTVILEGFYKIRPGMEIKPMIQDEAQGAK